MNQLNPLVTFALFSYKQESYIREAVQGAFDQTYSPLEIIISDDASPDRTYAIIEEMVADYRGLHKIILNRNESNLGIGAHVEKVFGIASGEWIVGAAGDDVSLPNRCEALLQAAKVAGQSCRGLASGWILIDEQGDVVESGNADAFLKLQEDTMHITGLDACRAVLFDRTNQLPGCSTMWHRSVFRGWPPFLSHLSWEDMTLSCRAHLSGTVSLIDKKLVKYRITPGAVTNSPKISGTFSSIFQNRIRRQTALAAKIVGFKQFMIDIEYASSEIQTDSRCRVLQDEVEEQIAYDSAISRWASLTTADRILEFVRGRNYPFGRRGITSLKHLVPLTTLGRLASILDNIVTKLPISLRK